MPRGKYPRKTTHVVDRILRRTRYVLDSGCFIFTGALDPHGYGRVGLGSRAEGTAMAHRVMYEQMRGPVPAGLDLDHLCRVRACCNPFHLEPVTRLVNVRRGAGHGGVLAGKQ